MPASATLYTFSLDDSPAEIEVLSTNTLYDLVAIGFEVCSPRPGEDVNDHLWNITVHTGKKFAYCGAVSPQDCYGPYEDALPDAKATTLAQIAKSLKTGMKLVLEYDYGTTSEHTFTVSSSKRVQKPSLDEFPRRKKCHPSTALLHFATNEINLDEAFSALDNWINSYDAMGATEINLFQAGQKQKYGYLENENPGFAKMIHVADKPVSLNHYLQCLNAAASVRSCHYAWHSVVVLPSGSRKISKYCNDLEEGFVDAVVVPPKGEQDVPDLATIFPKVAALAGYRKDKSVKKGWIRYKSNTLIVAAGKEGGTSTRPNAPKFTSYDGTARISHPRPL